MGNVWLGNGVRWLGSEHGKCMVGWLTQEMFGWRVNMGKSMVGWLTQEMFGWRVNMGNIWLESEHGKCMAG